MSGEHVWPEWIWKLLPEEQRKEQLWYQWWDRTKNLIRRARFRLFDLTVKDICDQCNTQWMSALEDGAAFFASGMVQGRGRHLHERGQQVLATWIILKALVAARSFPRGVMADFIPPDHYEALYALRSEQTPPSGVIVTTARVPWSLGQADYGFYHLNGIGVRGVSADESERQGYIATFSVLDFVGQVVWPYDPALIGDWRYIKSLRNSVRQIWPVEGPFIWPPTPILNKSGLYAIAMGTAKGRF
jgi:hypothetical protein